MTPANAAVEIVAFVATAAAAGGLADAAMTEPQSWTVLGLLAALVLGVGWNMVKTQKESGDKTATAIEKSNDRVAAALEKHAEAQTQTATNLALLIRESAESRAEGEEERRQILDKLDNLPDRVAMVLRK
jgi:flagellar biosynthesis/type III secretory pathway M-ring protein FliF/YscJ